MSTYNGPDVWNRTTFSGATTQRDNLFPLARILVPPERIELVQFGFRRPNSGPAAGVLVCRENFEISTDLNSII
jgi:hypothetical protein